MLQGVGGALPVHPLVRHRPVRLLLAPLHHHSAKVKKIQHFNQAENFFTFQQILGSCRISLKNFIENLDVLKFLLNGWGWVKIR
jgi:hypothetical protein